MFTRLLIIAWDWSRKRKCFKMMTSNQNRDDNVIESLQAENMTESLPTRILPDVSLGVISKFLGDSNLSMIWTMPLVLMISLDMILALLFIYTVPWNQPKTKKKWVQSEIDTKFLLTECFTNVLNYQEQNLNIQVNTWVYFYYYKVKTEITCNFHLEKLIIT